MHEVDTDGVLASGTPLLQEVDTNGVFASGTPLLEEVDTDGVFALETPLSREVDTRGESSPVKSKTSRGGVFGKADVAELLFDLSGD